jgi:uncharacterized protein YllA (UPF0747 family)
MPDDKIAESLGLEPVEKEKPVITINAAETDIEKDFQYTRYNLQNVIEQGAHALDEMIEIAKQSQQPRAFEVVSTLINTLAAANKDLMEINKRYKDMSPESVKKNTITNNLFVGSTSELLKMIGDRRAIKIVDNE